MATPDSDSDPDVVVDLFRIGEGGCLWAPAHTLPDGVVPGDYVVVGDGCDAELAVALVVDVSQSRARFDVLGGTVDDHRDKLFRRNRPTTAS